AIVPKSQTLAESNFYFANTTCAFSFFTALYFNKISPALQWTLLFQPRTTIPAIYQSFTS
ncbi:MAG: hypothetical protein Q7R34_15995, partial [Dehalococcoidia bacterium]|nr:hypothetical protein [Dehalococcoidia bacterium]